MAYNKEPRINETYLNDEIIKFAKRQLAKEEISPEMVAAIAELIKTVTLLDSREVSYGLPLQSCRVAQGDKYNIKD